MQEDDQRSADGCLELRSGRKVILATPDLLDAPAVKVASGRLLSAIGQGAQLVIVDMSATVVCDYAAADSIVQACTRAIEAGAEVRLVALNQLVHSMLRISGLGLLVCVYASLSDAIAGPVPAAASAACDATVPA